MFKDNESFTGFSVNDLAAARTFYGEKLGLTIREEPNMGFHLEFAHGGTGFVYEKPDHRPADFTVLNFIVDDINKTVAALTEAGITLERYDDMPAPQDESGVLRGRSVNMGPDIIWFKDPAGNILSALQN